MNKEDTKALQSLQIFLDDHDVTDIDVEPKGQGMGYTITASRGKKPAYQSYGKTIRDAVTNMVRAVSR